MRAARREAGCGRRRNASQARVGGARALTGSRRGSGMIAVSRRSIGTMPAYEIGCGTKMACRVMPSGACHRQQNARWSCTGVAGVPTGSVCDALPAPARHRACPPNASVGWAGAASAIMPKLAKANCRLSASPASVALNRRAILPRKRSIGRTTKLSVGYGHPKLTLWCPQRRPSSVTDIDYQP